MTVYSGVWEVLPSDREVIRFLEEVKRNEADANSDSANDSGSANGIVPRLRGTRVIP